MIIRNRALNLLLKNKETSKLSSHYLDIILDCFKIQNVYEGEQIGSSAKSKIVFFVLEGSYQRGDHKGITNEVIGSDEGGNRVVYGSLKEDMIEECEGEVLKFLSNGKIAWAKTSEILKAFNCSLE